MMSRKSSVQDIVFEREGVPPLISQLIDLAHTRDARAKAGADFKVSTLHPDTASSALYAEYERRAAEAARDAWVPSDLQQMGNGEGTFTEVPEHCLEITCQYDARQQTGDQRGAVGKQVYPKPRAQPGPLEQIFYSYARRDESATNVVKFNTGESEDTSLMSRTETIQFAEDWDLFPKNIRRSDVMQAFKHADRPTFSLKAGQEVNRLDQLNFAEFVDVLCKMAILAFDRPELTKQYPDDDSRVDALLDLLGCNSTDSRHVRTKLAHLDRTYRLRQENKAFRKWEYVGGAKGCTAMAMRRIQQPTPDAMYDRMMKYDRSTEKDEPQWVTFSKPALDCGTAVLGEARRFRVVLRNRNLCANVGVRISVHDAPFVHATFAEGPLAPGIPRVIEITAGAHSPGEWLGHITVDTGPASGAPPGPRSRHEVPLFLKTIPKDRELLTRAGTTLGISSYVRRVSTGASTARLTPIKTLRAAETQNDENRPATAPGMYEMPVRRPSFMASPAPRKSTVERKLKPAPRLSTPAMRLPLNGRVSVSLKESLRTRPGSQQSFRMSIRIATPEVEEHTRLSRGG